ncbi:substrate-binding domain-containing protein [Neptunicella sp.]|uniref:substrate-binding domain-containing protein n=1 Tax=Neptunicella sp. TaxID=2125986 RepID=UPI003F690C43
MKSLLFCTLMLLSSIARADIAVIVHPSNADAMDANDISKIFLGKSSSFPGGSKAVPVNQGEDQAARTEFDDKVLNKSASQLKAYWSKLLFTGKGSPPQNQANDSEVIALVASNPNIIGYVDAAAVNDSVKVVATF